MKEKSIQKEVLYDLYIVKNMNITDIAKEYNISTSALYKKLKKNGIKKDKEQIVQKAKETNIARRGKDYAKKSEEQILKMQRTCMERYGTTNPMKNKEIQQKAKNKIHEINNDRERRKQSLSKREKTCLRKYGVTNVSKLKQVKFKKEETFMKRYGAKNIFYLEEFKNENKKRFFKKHRSKKSSSNARS